MKTLTKQQQGKASRRKGKKFEQATYHFLNNLGYFVTKWGNNVDLIINPPQLTISKGNRFHTPTGFPDYLAFKPINKTTPIRYEVILVECKINNTLDKKEKLQLNHYQYTLNIPCYICYPHPQTNQPTLRKHTKYTPNPNHKHTPKYTPNPNQKQP